jgi:hypothetical protein
MTVPGAGDSSCLTSCGGELALRYAVTQHGTGGITQSVAQSRINARYKCSALLFTHHQTQRRSPLFYRKNTSGVQKLHPDEVLLSKHRFRGTRGRSNVIQGTVM